MGLSDSIVVSHYAGPNLFDDLQMYVIIGKLQSLFDVVMTHSESSHEELTASPEAHIDHP